MEEKNIPLKEPFKSAFLNNASIDYTAEGGKDHKYVRDLGYEPEMKSDCTFQATGLDGISLSSYGDWGTVFPVFMNDISRSIFLDMVEKGVVEPWRIRGYVDGTEYSYNEGQWKIRTCDGWVNIEFSPYEAEQIEEVLKPKKERRLLCSRIKTPDGTILESKYTHDFVQHVDATNGDTYILDGGTDYQRTSLNTIPAEDCSIYSDMPFDVIRQHLKRGTFDEKGEPIWKPLCTLSDEHLANILTYNEERGMGDHWYNDYIREEIEYRKEHNIKIEDNFKKQ